LGGIRSLDCNSSRISGAGTSAAAEFGEKAAGRRNRKHSARDLPFLETSFLLSEFRDF